MVSVLSVGLVMMLLCGLAAFCLGRLTVIVFRLSNVVFRFGLLFIVALTGMLVTIAPLLYLGLRLLNDPGMTDARGSSNMLTELSVPVGLMIYWAIIYLSYRMGTGRVHGHG